MNNIKANTNNVSSFDLVVARRNTAFLVAFFYLQELFWLGLSRFSFIFFEPMYKVANFEWIVLALYVAITIFFAIFSVFLAYIVRPLKGVMVSSHIVNAFIVISIIVNLYVGLTMVENARYTSGGLVGSDGLLYGLSGGLSLASMVLFVKTKSYGATLPRSLLAVFILSLVFIIDGLASALTVILFIVIILDFSMQKPGNIVALLLLVFGFAVLGFQAKFSFIPDYLTPKFMVGWMVSRFSIQAEQMYFFLAGESIIGESVSFFDLIIRAISNRFDLVLQNSIVFEYPRSVSEALMFDRYAEFGGGSSPGALLGTMLMGPFFFLAPLIFTFLLVQFFYGISTKVGFFKICAYSFLFKTLHANISEYFTIISPTAVVVFFFLIASLIRVDKKLNI